MSKYTDELIEELVVSTEQKRLASDGTVMSGEVVNGTATRNSSYRQGSDTTIGSHE